MKSVPFTAADWLVGSYFSTLELTPFATGDSWNLFTAGVSQPALESGRATTRADTNIPRSGDAGLPLAYEGLVYDWTARVDSNVPDDVLRRWATTTTVTAVYNQKRYQTLQLDALIDWNRTWAHAQSTDFVPLPTSLEDARAALSGKFSPLPLHLRENLSYSVQLQSTDRAALKAVRDALCDVPPAARDALAKLEVLLPSEHRSVLSLLAQGLKLPTLRLTVSLWGLWRQTVV